MKIANKTNPEIDAHAKLIEYLNTGKLVDDLEKKMAAIKLELKPIVQEVGKLEFENCVATFSIYDETRLDQEKAKKYLEDKNILSRFQTTKSKERYVISAKKGVAI